MLKKKYLPLVIIFFMLACSSDKEIDQPETKKVVIPDPVIPTNTIPKEFNSFNDINKTTSFYNGLLSSYKSYTNFNKFREMMGSINNGVVEHLSSAYSYIDFDKDGDSDFIFASTSYTIDNKYIYIIENKGDGVWSLFKKIDGFVWPRKGGVADFDNNGYLDFFVADHGYEAQGIPSLGAPLGIVYFYKDDAKLKYIPNSTAFNHTATAGDIDNDGDTDIVTIDNVYRNTNGEFSKENNITIQQQNGYYHAELMDLNNDGKLDLVAGNSENYINGNGIRNYTRIFWNNGDGKFRYENATELPLPNVINTFGMVDDIDFLDFNNDGKMDIILNRSAAIPGINGYYIQFLQNNGDKTFKEVSEERISNYKFSTTNQFIWFVWIRLLDLNKDNKLDIIVREGAAPGSVPEIEKEWYWINDGNNNYQLKNN